MNVLLLGTHLKIGGIASYVYSLAKALRDRGHNVLCVSSGGEMVHELKKEGIRHKTLDIKTKSELSPKVLLAIPRLISLVKDEGIDIIHAHTRVTQVTASIVSRITRIPYVTTCHGFFRPRFFRRMFKCWGNRSIAISDAVGRHLAEDFKVPVNKIVLIYNGIEIDRFKNKPSREVREYLKKTLKLKRGIVIGAIGRFSSVKGYNHLIEAFSKLYHKYKDVQLLIVGQGPEEGALKRLASDLGIAEEVVFAKPRFHTQELFSIIDIFASTSIQEGLGLSLAEAMASGTPVVATDVGGVSSLVKNGDTGLLVRSKDTDAFRDAMLLLINDTELKERLVKGARRLVERHFSLDHMADKVEKLYRGVVSESLSMNRILIVTVNWLGDVLFTTPFIKAIKRRYPESYIACMVVPRAREILEGNPNVDEVIIYDEDGREKSLLGKLKLIWRLRRSKFDGAFILHRSFTRALMVALSNVEKRIGYGTKNRGILLTKTIEEPDMPCHKIEYFLHIAKECGADTNDKDYEFFVNKADEETIDKLLKEKGINKTDRMVILNPGGNWPPKRWPKEHFAQLADMLANKLNLKVVITGAFKDKKLVKYIQDSTDADLVDLSGSTSLKMLGALMKRAQLVVSSDSGPMHLAASVRTRVIALFGPTSDALTGPYGTSEFTVIKREIDCQVPCYEYNCRDHKCMRSITVDEVYEKAKEMLTG